MPLQFDQYVNDISTADVLLTQGTGHFSWTIRTRTRGYYTHAGFFIWGEVPAGVGFQRLFVLEAMQGVGVRLIPFDYYLDYYIDYKGGIADWYQCINPSTGQAIPALRRMARTVDGRQYYQPDDTQIVDRLGTIQHALTFWTGQNNYAWWELLRIYGLFTPYWLRSRVLPHQPNHRYCSHYVADSFIQGGGVTGDSILREAHDSDPAKVPPDAIGRFNHLRKRGSIVKAA